MRLAKKLTWALLASVAGALTLGLAVIVFADKESVATIRTRGKHRLWYWNQSWKVRRFWTQNLTENPNVDEHVLADRVRSKLGPLEKFLDIPHLHVTVEGHRVILHGDVDTRFSEKMILKAVGGISGVHEVVSHLHIGLLKSDTRPSRGRDSFPASPCKAALLDAAQGSGVGAEFSESTVGAVLLTLSLRLTPEIRRHLFSHLPHDVMALMPPERWDDAPITHIRHFDDFVATAAGFSSLDPVAVRPAIAGVLAALKAHVPEEVVDIGAILPTELEEVWKNAV